MLSQRSLLTGENASFKGDLWGLAPLPLSRSRVISQCRLTSQSANHWGYWAGMGCHFPLNSFDLCSGTKCELHHDTNH